MICSKLGYNTMSKKYLEFAAISITYASIVEITIMSIIIITTEFSMRVFETRPL